MVSKTVTVTNPDGLHMRPAGEFTKAVAPFDVKVKIKFGGKDYNGKSIMNILAAGIKCGDEIEVECDGADEQTALEKALEVVTATE